MEFVGNAASPHIPSVLKASLEFCSRTERRRRLILLPQPFGFVKASRKRVPAKRSALPPGDARSDNRLLSSCKRALQPAGNAVPPWLNTVLAPAFAADRASR